MLSRLVLPFLSIVLMAGCASNTAPTASATASAPASWEPSAIPTAAGADTISGTVEAGVEPNCLILRDSNGSHVLTFDNPELKTKAKAGSKVTLTGRSEPTMMTTCQQGVVFIVTSVSGG